MRLFHRSASHQRIVELEDDNAWLRGELEEAYKARNLAWMEIEQARRENKTLNRNYLGAVAAVRVLMKAVKAAPVVVWFKENEQ
jgi:hypothetical protein